MKYSKSVFCLFILINALLSVQNSAKAATVYDGNISALNINILSDILISYTNHGERTSDLFEKNILYRTMGRVDEYGDDGSTIKTYDSKSKSDTFIADIWADVNHINNKIHYDHDTRERIRFNLASIGANIKPVDLKYGNISFGGFVSYINTKSIDVRAYGDAFGVFANYRYRNFGVRTLTNIGSLNNDEKNINFNNSWINVAADAYTDLKINNTLYLKPSMYIGYTWVSSDDLYINGTRISSSDFNFLNLAPSVQLIQKITYNLYGSLSAKYVMHLLGDNHIYVGNSKIDSLDIDNHTDVGINLEYYLRKFVFGGNAHYQIGDINGWSFNLNMKYSF